jgi:hypothetical protein
MMNLAQSSAYVMCVFGEDFTNIGIINEKILLSNITNLYQEKDTDNHLNQFFSDSISL